MDDRAPGMRWRQFKGYAGDREGKYLALYEFDSTERLVGGGHIGYPGGGW